MAILPYQDDLRTDMVSPVAMPSLAQRAAFSPRRQVLRGAGTFTSSGARRTLATTMGSANFEVRFHENQPSFFDVFYGLTADNGSGETSGVQKSSTGPATTFSCGTGTLTNGLDVTYTAVACPTPTPTPTQAAAFGMPPIRIR